MLKPLGALLFSEHGLSPDPKVQRWQRRIEPYWTPLAGGGHLTRPMTASIEAAYLPKAPRALGWCEWGLARPG